MKNFPDQSSVPPMLIKAEVNILLAAKADYDAGRSRRYLAVLADMRSRSKNRVLDEYRAKRKTRHQTVDEIFKHDLRSA